MKKTLPFIFIFVLFFLFPTHIFSQSAASHPDINLKIRNWAGPFSGKKEFIEEFHPVGSDALDPKAPELNTLLNNNPHPAIINLYKVYDWNWETNTKKNTFCQRPKDLPPSFDFFSLVGFQAPFQTDILVPVSGYDIGNGNTVLILYADSNSITLKYTAEDDVVAGYTIHLQNFSVDSKILEAYNQANSQGRQELPALHGGCKIGTANNSGEILVAIRDTGSFMDPRWFYDWWNFSTTGSTQNCQPSLIKPIKIETNIVEGPTVGFSDWLEKREDKKITAEEKEEENSDSNSDENKTENSSSHENIEENVKAAWSSIFSGSATPVVHYPKINFPKFSPISHIFKNALHSLLPAKINPLLKGDTNTKISTIAISYKGSELNELDPESASSCENGEMAKHERNLSSSQWGTAALGAIGLNGPLIPKNKLADLKYFKGENKYKLKIEEPEDYPSVCKKPGFGPGDETPEQNYSEAQDIKPELFLKKLWLAISSILKNHFLHKTTKKKVKFVFKESLPAGHISAQYSTSLAKTFLPYKVAKKFIPKDEAEALTVNNGFNASIAFSPPQEGFHPEIYKDLGRKRNFDCALLCSIYPKKWVDKGMAWVGKEKICPSCNPKDYEFNKIIPRKPPSPLPQYCHWNPSYYACDYYVDCKKDVYLPQCSNNGTLIHGCGANEGPVCEDCSDIPDCLYPDEDLSWCGGQAGPKSCWPNKSEVRCKFLTRLNWEEDIYDDPAYNGCYYANLTVKVRKNFVGCDGVCNDACPAD